MKEERSMNEEQRRQAFKKWLVDQGYGHDTASSYASGVKKNSKRLLF